jgi:XisH protein
MLEEDEPERLLFLAVPIDVYETFFQTRFSRMVLARYPLKLITYEPNSQEILQWIG